jgi:hypothetical protein
VRFDEIAIVFKDVSAVITGGCENISSIVRAVYLIEVVSVHVD